MRSSSGSKICFFFEQPVNLRERSRLKTFLEKQFRKERRPLQSLNYIFCSDRRLHAINREYLKHDTYTDIITFELSPSGQPIEAEIYISVDRVRDNATALKQSLRTELHRVMFHGALHLCGYKDKSMADQKLMRRMEDHLLKTYF